VIDWGALPFPRGAVTWLWAACLLGQLAACGSSDSIPIPDWELSAGGAPVAVTLPARLGDHLGDRRQTYRLAAEVPLPPAWRGRALTLNIPSLGAMTRLRAGGRAAHPLGADLDAAYRARGQQIFHIAPEETRTELLRLELEVEHTWTQSAWHDTIPRLSDDVRGDAVTRRIARHNAWAGAAALATLVTIAFTYLVLFLLDRSRTEYGWLSLQTIAAAVYPIFVLGVAEPYAGTWELPLLVFGLLTAIWASLYAVSAQFSLPRSRRIWIVLWLSSPLAAILFSGPFSATPILGPMTVGLLTVGSAYQVVRVTRLLPRRKELQGVVPNLVSWVLLALLGTPDFLLWFGLPDPLGGLRLATVPLTGFALMQFVALSHAHLVSRKRADELNLELQRGLELVRSQKEEIELLNVELRRQIGERSRQLSEALSRLAVARPDRMTLVPGEVVDDRYQVVRAIGSGAMGAVYEVERLADERAFALKVLTRVSSAEHMARFAREAQLASGISHPNIVDIVDVGFDRSGFMFLVMELVDGRSLAAYKDRYGDPAWTLPIIHQIALGLAAIHAQSVVHRDLKPGNILLAVRAGELSVKIADFGISGLSRPVAILDDDEEAASAAETADIVSGSEPSLTMETAPPPEPERRGGKRRSGKGRAMSDPVLTQAGRFLGTPRYMAPELAGGSAGSTPASDVFSVAVLAFELLTGAHPFEVPPCVALLRGEVPLPARPLDEVCPDLDPPLVAAIHHGLELDPARRPTAEELADATAQPAGLRDRTELEG
jgi:serine/threonine protein kinase